MTKKPKDKGPNGYRPRDVDKLIRLGKPTADVFLLAADLQKRGLEVQALEKDLASHGRRVWLPVIAPAVSFVGVAATLLVFYLSQQSLVEREHAQARTARQVAIVSEFDKLYSDTLTAFETRARNGTFFAANVDTWVENMSNFATRFRKNATPDDLKLIDHSRVLALQIQADLNKRDNEVALWMTGAGLQSRWRAVKDSPTPDFEAVLGSDLQEKWPEVQNAAMLALSEKLGFLGDNEARAIAKFEAVSANFRKSLYLRVNNQIIIKH